MALHEGLEKLPDERGQGVPQQEEAQVEVRENLGELGVRAEPCGLV